MPEVQGESVSLSGRLNPSMAVCTQEASQTRGSGCLGTETDPSLELPSVGKPGWLSQSSGKGFFLCLGRTRVRASYSSTIPELQGGEGWRESLMQPPETFQDDWKRKGSNVAGPIIASGLAGCFPTTLRRN